jgi:F-type H+-transporting ATPase subunit alpha
MEELKRIFESIETTARESRFRASSWEEGTVVSVGDGIVQLSGLSDATMYELIELESGDVGIVFDLAVDSTGIVLLTQEVNTRAGHKAYKTGRIGSVGVGEELLGRVVDALGAPLDEGPEISNTTPYSVEREAPTLVERDFVSESLFTGIKVIDAMLPIGRGQRELIIGDSSTGKTAMAVDAIINQKHSDVICVYVAIGQKKAVIIRTIEELRAHGDFSRVVFVAADASNSVGLQFIAPYSATAIAEYFREKGRDVLIVYDDLTKHAEAYRTLSLLLKRPPGREAFPGDIFYIHSRLLERSAKISHRFGGGSITALPIIETQQGRVSSFIPTNLISITDGQIYLDASLFSRGLQPAADVGMSVSRIGGKAQDQAMQLVAERLKIDYARFIEVEVFTKFGSRLEEETAKLIRRGQRLREMLKQPRFEYRALEEQVMEFVVLESGALDGIDLEAASDTCRKVAQEMADSFPDVARGIREKGVLEKADYEKLLSFARESEGANA